MVRLLSIKSTFMEPDYSSKHHKLKYEAIAILGIPIDNVTLTEAVDDILELIEEHQERKPGYVGTVNVDFLMNTVGWTRSSICHPELLSALRNADFNTSDGMPIVWLSRALNCQLKERVSGADFIPRLIEQCSKLQKSIFLLGADSQIAHNAAKKLKEEYPTLNIAGIASPHIFVTGEELEKASEKDTFIINQINASNPSLLLIFFGNPKQEIWFQRIRHQLSVPVAIGGGGTLNFVSGNVSRAPTWMQHLGLEWLHRLIKEPKRLWKRYLYDLTKLLYVALPLLTYHYYQKFLHHFHRARGQHFINEINFSSSKHHIAVITLPVVFDHQTSWNQRELFEDALKNTLVIIDFRSVLFINAAAIGFLLRLWRYVSESHRQIYLVAVSPAVKKMLELQRVWIQFHSHYYDTIEDLIAYLNTQSEGTVFFETIETKENYAIVNFFGQIDASQDHQEHLARITTSLENRHVILNLQYCTFIDSSGMGFLLKLKRYFQERKKNFILCQLTPGLQQMLHVSKVDSLFQIFHYLDEAKSYLKKAPNFL